MAYKRFFAALLGCALALLAVVAGINYFVDPAMIFGRADGIRSAAEWVAGGHSLGLASNTDERILQREIITARAGGADVLVLGSSRIMACGSEVFHGATLYSATVSGATVHDLIALTEIYLANHPLPRQVIIGVDPWSFNAVGFNDQRYRSIEDYYARGLARLHLSPAASATVLDTKYKQLLSRDYLLASLQILREGRGEHGFSLLETASNYDESVILPDGSHIWPRESRERTPERVNAEVAESLQRDFYGMELYDELDAALVGELTALVHYLRAEGCAVAVYRTPLHPLAYEHLRTNARYQMFSSADEQLVSLAASEGCALLGSFNPAEVGAGDADFMDYFHLRREVQTRLMSAEMRAKGIAN